MKIGTMKAGEEELVFELVWRVFQEFEAPVYSQQGIAEFRAWIEPRNLAERFTQPGNFLLCCWEAEELVGVIALRNRAHISLLFVDARYQRRGIARQLLHATLARCVKADPELEAITVNASPYALTAYEKLGFIPTKPEQVYNGIRFTPMRLGLSHTS